MEPSSVGEMQFLFKKVDQTIFELNGSRNESTIEICLRKCLEEANSLNTQLSLLVSTTLKRILTLYRDFSRPLSIDISRRIVDYVLKKWDSSVDVICYEAVDSFGLLLDIHKAHCPHCVQRTPCELRQELIDSIFASPATCRSSFKCIALLASAYPWMSLINDDFVRILYKNIVSPSLVVVISDIICANLASSSSNTALHLDQIAECLQSDVKSLRNAIMDRLIPNLVKKGHSALVSRLQAKMTGEGWECSTSHLETVLSLVSMLIKCSGGKTWSDFVAKEVVSKAILHSSPQVRLTAWNLVCIHPRLSIPYSSTDLSLMQVYLRTSAAEQSPAIRQKLLAVFKQVLIRLAETAEQMIKRRQDGELLKQYDEFLCVVVRQAFAALGPQANFNRRLISLSLIDQVYRQEYLRPNGKRAFWDVCEVKSLIGEAEYGALLGCLDDPFQLCQTMSLELLDRLQDFTFGRFEQFRDETRKIMTSIRSYNSLAASYRFQFYVRKNPERLTEVLEELMGLCEGNLKEAQDSMMQITDSPIHPILSVLVALLPKNCELMRQDLSFWSTFVQSRLIPFCYQAAALVTPVVHSMAPEGYIPDEELQSLACGDSSARMHANRSQMLLVCCWRTHKHISEILDWAVRTCYPLLEVDVHRIGEYFWLQLTECRHCGAFESAVDGFTFLCSFLWRQQEPALPRPLDWLRRILKALEGGEDLDNLCSTRRSAGVPHLVVAILATEPENGRLEGLELAAEALLQMEGRELKYRIHCLNVLKAIIHSSALHERVSFLLEPACRLAVAGCSAASWSERNSSAQLAAALRTHIFGVTRSSQRDLHVDGKNRQSAHEFFSRFPSLYAFLYEQLCSIPDEFSAYPTLIFLTHLYPTNTVTKYRLAPFIPLCLKTLLWCKAEKLRRLCAVAAIAICQVDDLELILDWLDGQRGAQLEQNHVNAVLLLLQAILVAKPEAKERVAAIVGRLDAEECCEFNRSLLQELWNQLEGREDSFSSRMEVAKVQKEVLERKSFVPLISRQKAERMELYGWLYEAEQKREDFDGLEELLERAKRDFEERDGDEEGLLVKKVLDKYYREEFMSDWDSREEETEELLPESSAVTHSLLARRTGEEVERQLAEWARGTIDLEEDYPKRKAIAICTQKYRQEGNGYFLKVLMEMLQDEDPDIREETASSVSLEILSMTFPLNPEVCRYLLAKKLPEGEAPFMRETATSDETLFDASAANVYAEPALFGDFSVVDSLL